MTVGALAEASMLSKGFISQVENGVSSPSLSSLRRIAESLSMPLTQLLGEPPAPVPPAPHDHSNPRVVRANQHGSFRPWVEVISDGPTRKVLTVVLSRGVDLLGAPHAALWELEEGFCYVLRGGVEFRQEGFDLDLYAGDSLTWSPTQGYVFQALQSPCKLLLCLPSAWDLPSLGLPPASEGRRPSGVGPSAEGPFRLVEMRAQRGTDRRR